MNQTRLCGFVGLLFITSVVTAVPLASSTHGGDVIPVPGPDWRYEVLYRTLDGSILVIVASPPDQPGGTIVHDGEALLDLTGNPVGYAIFQDAQRRQLDLWYIDLVTGTPVRREPVSLATSPSLLAPFAILAAVFAAGGGVGLIWMARWHRSRRKGRGGEKAGKD